MDYEKAYKAALETATKWIKDGCIDKEKICLECVFPELRESEIDDERIRKGLIKLLTVASEVYLVDSTGIKKDYYLAYLEKRQENPKSTDSIPSDCVSDAKFEDRWHKVSDSLPDNPREVLCKDEVGNYFIGRYYVGEGWDISNYDYEDKPNHLNPPVSKWIDFPSEKQKESLHDSEICKEKADSFTDEDERIRKELVEKISNLACGCFISQEQKQRFIHYLERQKVPENVSATAMAPSCWEVEQKEQKPAEWIEEDEEMIKMILGDLEWGRRNTTVKKDIHLYDEKIAWLKSLRPQYHGDVTEAYKMGLEAGKASSWKPSKEQMRVLSWAANGMVDKCIAAPEMRAVLRELYEHLKKLGVKEEPEYYQHFDPDC